MEIDWEELPTAREQRQDAQDETTERRVERERGMRRECMTGYMQGNQVLMAHLDQQRYRNSSLTSKL